MRSRAVADRAEVVVIHDAARPLVTDDLIRRTVTAAAEAGAAIAALRAHDTVKRADAAGVITATLPRERDLSGADAAGVSRAGAA